MERAPQTFFAIALFLLGCSACEKKDVPTSHAVADPTNLPPDLVMEKMHVQNYGDNGISWDLHSPLARAFTKQNKMLAQNLTVTLFNHDERSTVITADTGTFNSAESKPGVVITSTFNVAGITLNPGDMFLEGHVVAISTEGNKMMTDWAHFKRTVGLIVSSAPVEVDRDDSITKGIGFEATADLSQIKIFHQTVLIKDKGQ